jgi:hypothetical protein
MKTNTFKRIAIQTIDPKATKEGVRNTLRKRGTISLSAAIVFVQVALMDLLGSLAKYRLGFPIKQDEKDAARADLGFIIRHLVIAAKLLKVKVPPAQRKVKVTGTFLDNMLALEFPIGALFRSYSKAFSGAALTTEEMGPMIIQALNAAYALSWSLLGIPASEIMASHVEALKTSGVYPNEIFAEPEPKAAPTKLTEEEKAKRAADALAAAPAIAAAKAEAKAAREAAKAAKVAAKAAAQLEAAKALIAAQPKAS